MPLFRQSQRKKLKNAIKALRGALSKLVTDDEKIQKNLAKIKDIILYAQTETKREKLRALVTHEFYEKEIFQMLILNLDKIHFESRKDVATVFVIILGQFVGNRYLAIEYLCANPYILYTLLRGYENRDIAFNCGIMLRECAHYEPLVRLILFSQHFFRLFDYMQQPEFGVAIDAFLTFKELLVKHKWVTSEYLDYHYVEFFRLYQNFMKFDNFVTKQLSLNLLGELLTYNDNKPLFVTLYLSDVDNLKFIMNRLKDTNQKIQFEAVQIFKIFVCNQYKQQRIIDLLTRNQMKILQFLTEEFKTDLWSEKEFNDQMKVTIDEIRRLKKQ